MMSADVQLQGAHEMILEMVAWRDPNLLPIKAFYGDDIKVNFCGKLATDRHVQVGRNAHPLVRHLVHNIAAALGGCSYVAKPLEPASVVHAHACGCQPT